MKAGAVNRFNRFHGRRAEQARLLVIECDPLGQQGTRADVKS